MNDAERLLAQVSSSTDPERLLRMAREAKRREPVENCPFCGAAAEEVVFAGIDNKPTSVVACTRCCASMPTREEWNRRPGDVEGR